MRECLLRNSHSRIVIACLSELAPGMIAEMESVSASSPTHLGRRFQQRRSGREILVSASSSRRSTSVVTD